MKDQTKPINTLLCFSNLSNFKTTRYDPKSNFKSQPGVQPAPARTRTGGSLVPACSVKFLLLSRSKKHIRSLVRFVHRYKCYVTTLQVSTCIARVLDFWVKSKLSFGSIYVIA
ncbi:hypothetical protein L1987_38116 [Smallanthus sonchifolius]|uniref:Uncharacterized protein n=1 Tax=Smallanthus sonchifolius TaxID=185202 RepID=A0ACB9HJM5_9ASTR|nr:hypothetical protein L1987_38116 [Smallanthus sonchifolius]